MRLRRWAMLLPLVLLVGCGSIDEMPNEKDFNASETEFTLGQNLNSAITELALMYDAFDLSKTKDENYPADFISHYCQNSRQTYDYLEKVREENAGMISEEQVRYIQYSLTGEYIDFHDSIPEEGIDINQASSRLGFGKILSYEADIDGDEVKLVAEFERGTDGSEITKLYELDIVLIQNPTSCFDGYSIKMLTSEDITPIITGDNKEHTFHGYDLEAEENGIFTFENYGGEDDVTYGTHVIIDLSENATLADFVRENPGQEFDVTYFLDDSMTQPVYRVVPISIKLHENTVETTHTGEDELLQQEIQSTESEGKDVYVSKFTKEDFYLLSVGEDFYELIAFNPIDQKYGVGNAESTVDAVQKALERCNVWNKQIDYTGTQLRGLLNDSEYNKLQEAINLWKDYYQEKLPLYHILVGTDGMIPGSMYTQIAANILADDNKLIAFALLSLEYELSQNVQFVIQSEEGNLNPENINWYDFSEENACIEYTQDFNELLNSYSLDEKNSEELELLICETADRIQEIIGQDFDFVSHVNKYVSLINVLNEIEGQVSTDSRYITVKEERLRLYATQLLNVEYMLEECCYN